MTRIDALKIACASLLVVAAAACGGNGKSPSVASGGGTTTNSSNSTSPPSTSSGGGGPTPGGSITMAGGDASQMRKFAACMRSHGVPNFPDPNSNGSVTITGISPDSPSFQRASNACRQYAPNGGKPPSPAQQAAMQAQALKFSACMRSHGLPDFPDPQFSQGHASVHISKGQLDPQSPTFQAAQKACQKDLPGVVQSQKGAS